MPKRPVKAQASSTRAFGSGFSTTLGSSAFSSNASSLSYVWEPPDLSTISDPNLIVALKNLSKKDSTTKSKGLEEIQAHVSSSPDVEEALLQVWIQFYPRLSIDNARRVRQLAHTVQGRISVACGKRIAKDMPLVVGAWLAGTFDGDRAVAKAAQDALRQLFPTSEKLQGVRKAYQAPVLEFCQNAIVNETPQTLTDERTSSPDDVQAKYNRLVASCILLITSLLQELSAEDVGKQATVYVDLLDDEHLWKLSYHSEPQVRRSVHRLLRICLTRHIGLIETAQTAIGAAYIGHGLRSDQTGTSLDFVEALNALTALKPEIWSEHAKGPKGASRLSSFLKRGSQLGPPGYWPNVVALLRHLPRSAYGEDLGGAQEVLNALVAGIRKKEELRTSLPAAWRAYTHIAELLLDGLTFEDQGTLVKSNLVPILDQFVRPNEKTAGWEVPQQAASSVIDQVLEISSAKAVALATWRRTAQQLVEDMQTSLPEQSKDFRTSQDNVVKYGGRWIAVHGAFARHADPDGDDLSILQEAVTEVLRSAVELLRRRNGKPYGASAVVDDALYSLDLGSDALSSVELFVEERLSDLFCSPSASYLADILYFFNDRTWFKDVWESTLRNILEQHPDSLRALLSSAHIPQDFRLATTSPSLRRYIDEKTRRAIDGEADWSFLDNITQGTSKHLNDAIVNDGLLAMLTNSLTLDEKAPQALDGLHALMKTERKAVEDYLQKPEASKLLPRLLFLSESSNEDIAHSALSLNSLVQNGFTQTSGSLTSHETLFKTIQAGLLEASDTSVSINALKKLSHDFISRQNSPPDPDLIAGLLPAKSDWEDALGPLLAIPPLPALAMTSPLGGVLYLIDASSPSREKAFTLPRDAQGQCSALRIMAYVTSLLLKVPIMSLPVSRRVEVALLLSVSSILANDNLSVAGANHLWSQYNPEVETSMAGLVSDVQSVLHSLVASSIDQNSRESSADASPNVVGEVLEQLWSEIKDSSPLSRYSAEAYVLLTGDLVETHGVSQTKANVLAKQAAELRKEGQHLRLAALLHSHGALLVSTSVGSRWCGELVADLTAHDIATKSDDALQKLILLNLLFANIPDSAKGIAKQRTVFFMRHVLPWLQASSSDAIEAETLHVLAHVVPNIVDLFGEHWSQMLSAITEICSDATKLDPGHPEQHHGLATVYLAIKLYTVLSSASKAENDEPNDDLVDALKDAQQGIAGALFHLLTLSEECPDDYNQPLRMINELVSRRITDLQPNLYPSPEAVYPLLSTPSDIVQQAAYNTLHRQIPSMQEQISLDAALEKRNVKLPEELLSLILEAPTVHDLEDAPWDRGIPLPLRGYLLSWLLVFDHFGTASYKVKSDYLDSLKEISPLPGLLEFTFDFLGHRSGKPIDASKFDITQYNPSDSSGDAKKDCQQLLSHIYFMALQYTPGLVKAWWIDLRARALVSAVESWTEKYVSPQIISSALASISQWATEQSDPSNPNAASENERLKVATNHRVNEIRASYDIDEQTLSITIKLPGAWPLVQASVIGTSRVGVDEKKWQSWVRGCQGVITLSNNNIIDGLLAFRRNVAGAMKGQTECAICYSIISGDKQLPSKRCGTCKNLFHSTCLYKWFKTSNASTCPLCRNPFNYG